VIGDDKTWQGQRFSATQVHFVCPWHGYEFDLKTGECVPDRSRKLRAYPVVRRGEDIYVVTG
jgi:nitrite reductase/ring-hydroxylating ferredoxin subunit